MATIIYLNSTFYEFAVSLMKKLFHVKVIMGDIIIIITYYGQSF